MKITSSPPVISPVMNHINPSSDDAVRRKFFSALGIESKWSASSDDQTAGPATATATPVSPDSSFCCYESKEWVNPRTRDIVISHEPLKYNRQADTTPEKRRKTAGSSDSSLARKKRCGFNETVKIVPIPMRSEYSNRVRSRLWSNACEIHENAHRNTVEFAAEGWDWRTVTPDEGMYICAATGELIHPVHYEPNHFHPQPK